MPVVHFSVASLRICTTNKGSSVGERATESCLETVASNVGKLERDREAKKKDHKKDENDERGNLKGKRGKRD